MQNHMCYLKILSLIQRDFLATMFLHPMGIVTPSRCKKDNHGYQTRIWTYFHNGEVSSSQCVQNYASWLMIQLSWIKCDSWHPPRFLAAILHLMTFTASLSFFSFFLSCITHYSQLVRIVLHLILFLFFSPFLSCFFSWTTSSKKC